MPGHRRWLTQPRANVAAALAAAVALVAPSRAIDNGLGITPPRGWRSWNLVHGAVNDSVMRAQMAAVVDASRTVRGKPTTLASLGFSWVSADDGWQKCNCSFNHADPTLPPCPNCKLGGCSWHTPDGGRDGGGRPVVDTAKFPNVTDLVAHGHLLGLKVGWYLNNCICMEGGDPPMGEHCTSPTHYQQDVDFVVGAGFDGVKIDNCGSSHNVTLWAELFNKSGRPIRIESCHTFHPNHGTPSAWPNFPVWDPATKAGDAACPMNLYRTGGDIGPSFSSAIGETYATVQYTDRPDPFSHPGCWAYPDMQEIGNYRGPDPLRTDEEMTHWGLWCVVSAPLILGTDLSDKATMDRIWPTITNPDALAINDAWAGHPGTLVRSYPSANATSPVTVDQGPCDGGPATAGWRLDSDGKLHAPPSAPGAADQCLGTASGPAGQTTQQESSCPPPTTAFPGSGCGSLLEPCASVAGAWAHDNQTGALVFTPGKSGGKPTCLRASPTAPVGGFYGGPKAAITAASGGCPSKAGDPTRTFSVEGNGEISAGTGACLAARRVWGPQLWAKPVGGGRVAALVVNIALESQDFELPLADVPGLACASAPSGAACAVHDVWAGEDRGAATGSVPVELRPHQSAFLLLGP